MSEREVKKKGYETHEKGRNII